MGSYNELVQEINYFPILLISSPRSGSTLLMNKLKSEFYECNTYGEPVNDKYTMMDFLLAYNSNKTKYIVKEHSSRISIPWPEYPAAVADDLLNSDRFFKIIVKRKDKVAQVASLYISMMRDIWFYDRKYDYSEFLSRPLELNEEKVQSMVRHLDKFYDHYHAFKNVKCEIFYEDFNKLGPVTNLVMTPRPTNYSDLVKMVGKFV